MKKIKEIELKNEEALNKLVGIDFVKRTQIKRAQHKRTLDNINNLKQDIEKLKTS